METRNRGIQETAGEVPPLLRREPKILFGPFWSFLAFGGLLGSDSPIIPYIYWCKGGRKGVRLALKSTYCLTFYAIFCQD